MKGELIDMTLAWDKDKSLSPQSVVRFYDGVVTAVAVFVVVVC